jgi:hypothetical protein
MKTVIKLAIAAAVLHAVVRSGISVSTYYQLKDATLQLLIFGDDATTTEIHHDIVATAEGLHVALAAENVQVRREGVRTVAEGSYVEEIEFLPGVRYPVTYSFEVSALSTRR